MGSGEHLVRIPYQMGSGAHLVRLDPFGFIGYKLYFPFLISIISSVFAMFCRDHVKTLEFIGYKFWEVKGKAGFYNVILTVSGLG